MMTTEEWNDKPTGGQADPIAQARAEGRAEGIREATEKLTYEVEKARKHLPPAAVVLMAVKKDILALIDTPAPTPTQVRVKPLVWQSDEWAQREGSNESALSAFGRYYASHGAVYWGPGVVIATGYPNIEAAKDAAQSDYEARIMAALEPAQVSVAEAASMLRDEWRGSKTIDADQKAQDHADIHECDVDAGRIIEAWLRALSGDRT
jgi:hypothetical protein